MTEVIVSATAVRWVSDDSPRWVELQVVDTAGQTHRVLKKVPAVATSPITAASEFPFRWGLRAECDRIDGEAVEVRFVNDATTTEALPPLWVSTSIVRWL